MQKWRLAAIGAFLGGTTCAWLALAAPAPAPADISVVTPRKPVTEARANALAAEIERLHDRPRRAAAVLQPARNLFAFEPRAAAGPSPRQLVSPASPPPAPAATAGALSSTPPLRLVGFADDPHSGTRTAVLSGVGGPFLVRTGDAIRVGATVYHIDDMAADYVDVSDPAVAGSPSRLALR